jgi:isopenicillin N synthase-like dioxygenase
VHTRAGWIEAPPLPNTFVVNLGDTLERMSAGRYRSTPHRVALHRGPPGVGRLSFPLFLDPGWDVELRPLVRARAMRRARARWDSFDPAEFSGTYGQYLLMKVSRAFPALFRSTL